MNEFYNIVFSQGNIVSLGITAALLFLVPVVFWFIWHRGHKGELKFKYLLMGAIGFIVSARVLESGVHMFCIVLDTPVSRFINGSILAYVLYGITMAGVFEECGRHIVLKYIMKRDKTPENAVLYGIGHGGIEVWAVVLPTIVTQLTIAMMFSAGDIPAALSALNITEETAAAALPTVLGAAQFGPDMLVLTTVERIITMLVHTALTVIVFYGIWENKKGYLPMAIALHMVVDTFAALYQCGVVPLWLCEVWAAVWTVVIVYIAVKLYRRMKENKAGAEA